MGWLLGDPPFEVNRAGYQFVETAIRQHFLQLGRAAILQK